MKRRGWRAGPAFTARAICGTPTAGHDNGAAAMRILVLGAGGVGGYFGGRLAEGGADVTFLVRPRRRAQIAANGLIVRSGFGDMSLPVRTVDRGGIDAPYDLVLLSCKAYDLDDAMDAIAPAMGPDSAVLTIINGLRQVELLQARFGANSVLGGVCFVGASLDPETGIIDHFGPFHRIAFGELDGSTTPRARAFAALDDRVRFTIEPRRDIVRAMWDKCAGQGSLSSANVLTRAVVGDITRTPTGRAFLDAVLAEGRAICDAWGYPMTAQTIALYEKMFDTPGSPFATSMLRDLEDGKPTEGDHIVGDLVRRAAAKGIDTPILRCAQTALETCEAKRLAAAKR
jgi:2-dehydropantoate 2-reductase